MVVLKSIIAVVLLTVWSATNAAGQPATTKSSPQPLTWQAFVNGLWPEAQAKGVSRATFDAVFARITQPDCKQPGVYCSGNLPSGDAFASFRAKGLPETCFKVTQKEFLRPSAYFPQKYMRSLALRGRKLLESWKTERPDILAHLKRIEAVYNVDHKLLIALWGRETSYGTAPMKHNALRSLASMAFATAPARRPWARKQVLAALEMIERGHITFDAFRSSYAGATGLTQIMPDEYLTYGVDGDGDGRADIWNSIPDALATTANTLKGYGWDGAQKTWGYEIGTAAGSARFDCTMEGRAYRRPISAWVRDHGVARTGNAAFSNTANPGYLVLPSGTRGPKFLATDNFEVLRHYNTSDMYALFIGNLTERLGCETESKACPFAGAWPGEAADDFPYSVENLCRLQIALRDRGFSAATPDGLFGLQTRLAIGRYQKSLGQQPDCFPTKSIYEALIAAPGRSKPDKTAGASGQANRNGN